MVKLETVRRLIMGHEVILHCFSEGGPINLVEIYVNGKYVQATSSYRAAMRYCKVFCYS
jgi:hypothetical protein